MELIINQKNEQFISVKTNNCDCELSSNINSNSEYTIESNKELSEELLIENDNLSISSDNSLLDDNNFNLNNSDDNSINNFNNKLNEKDDDSNSIINEFKSFFTGGNQLIINEPSTSSNEKITKNLEEDFIKVFNKEDSNTKSKGENTEEIINKIQNEKDKIKLLKLICKLMEKKIFDESIIGWDFYKKVYKINTDKLKEKLIEINEKKLFNKKIIIGYIIKNYSIKWKDTFLYKNKLKEKEIEKKNQFIKTCHRNLENKDKFKKRIGDQIIRVFKKNFLNNNNNIDNVIFYVKITDLKYNIN